MEASISLDGKGFSDILTPVYFIRDSRPLNIKDYNPETGIHIRLTKINPKDSSFEIEVAQDTRILGDIAINIAEDMPRSDIIILEAKEFPGINLFWLGSIVMILGFIFALWQRTKKLSQASVS